MARLSSHVATRRTDLEHLFMADLHGAGFRASGLADVAAAGAGNRHDPRSARFAVVRRDRRGALQGLSLGVGAGWALEDHVATGHPANMKPPIVGPGYPEAQKIVVGIGPADQDLPPTWQRMGDHADLLGMRQ